MFESIVIRRTTASGSPYPLDLGRLAESMLFYQTVRLVLTRHSVTQLIRQCGPDLALEIVRNPNIDAVFADCDLAVRNEGVGSTRLRHRPVTIKVVDEPDEDMVVRLFREATGKSGKGRRMAHRFLAQARPHTLPQNLVEAAVSDWEDADFMRRAVTESINEFVPGYSVPDDLDLKLVRQEDDYHTFESNIDWPDLIKAHQRRTGEELSPGHLLVGIVEMRQDLHLGATFATGIALDPLGAKLLQAKCADLTAAVDAQQATIDQFHEVVVHGLTDLRSAVNSGALSFRGFLELLPDAEQFRGWLKDQTPDAELVKAYFAESTKRRPISSQFVKELRWLVPVASGFALFLPHADLAAPSVAGALTALDRFVVSRFTEGWRPAVFIDKKLRPAVNR